MCRFDPKRNSNQRKRQDNFMTISIKSTLTETYQVFSLCRQIIPTHYHLMYNNLLPPAHKLELCDATPLLHMKCCAFHAWDFHQGNTIRIAFCT